MRGLFISVCLFTLFLLTIIAESNIEGPAKKSYHNHALGALHDDDVHALSDRAAADAGHDEDFARVLLDRLERHPSRKAETRGRTPRNYRYSSSRYSRRSSRYRTSSSRSSRRYRHAIRYGVATGVGKK